MKSFRKFYSWWFVLAVVVLFGVLYLNVLYPWMNRWGLSENEAARALPGDGAVEGVVATSTRGITIHAPADEVWQWVVQLGQERAGFYSNDWLENLVLADIHNTDEIRPEWQQHQQGDKVLGAGGVIYGDSAFWPLHVYEAGKVTYLWGSIVVLPVDADTSVLIARTFTPPASPIAQAISAFTYDWMHFVMERGMLLGIKGRAEQTLGADALWRALAALGWLLATVGVGFSLFARRRGWWWGLIPLAYALAILFFTGDFWSALAGFLWWGITIAGFVLWGRRWWKGLILFVVAVILTFVLADQPHTAFGIIFLLASIVVSAAIRLAWSPGKPRPTVDENGRPLAGSIAEKIHVAPRFFLLLFSLLLIWVSLLPWYSLPAIVPANAPANQFSAERAMADLAFIAAEPRPSGSPRALAVREYLVDAIRGLGLTPEVQDVAMDEYLDEPNVVNHVTVHNVMARLPGRDSTQAVLVSGHYDSVPTSTGASDCGGCVATTLELLRVLRAGPQLEHDVIFLFTDAEELGVYGAQAFVDKHPWAKDARLTIVYEGLGVRGPSLLYAASPQSGWVIEQAAGQLVHPLVSSFVNDLMWKLAGNSGSDLDAFAKLGAGVALLTFGDQSSYHSLQDNVANLAPGNLQAHGDNGAALVRSFANMDLSQAASQPDRVFFNLLPGVVIQYSQGWAVVLGWLAGLAFVAVLAWALRSPMVRSGRWLLGVAALPVGLLACLLIVTVAWWLIRLTNDNLHAYLMGVTYQSAAFLLAFLGLGLAIFAGLYSPLGKWANQVELALGAMFWWALLAVLAPYGMPGLSYLFSWPLLFALVGLVWLLHYPGGSAWPPALCLALSAVAALLLIPPVIYQFNTFAGRMESLAGMPLAALPLFFLVLLLGLLWPQLAFISPRRWPLALAGLAIFVVCAAYASLNSGFDADHPKPNTVVYWMDADSGSASWITVNDSRLGRGTSAQLDPWTSQFFPAGATTTEFSPWLIWIPQAYPALTGSAPPVELPQPAVNIVQDEMDAGQRRLGLELTWPAGAYDGLWTIQSSGPIAGVAVDGAAIAAETGFGDELTLTIANPPGDEIGLEILAAPGPVTLTAQVRWLRLPSIPEHPIQARPDSMMPAPFNPTADSTFLYKTFRMPEGAETSARLPGSRSVVAGRQR